VVAQSHVEATVELYFPYHETTQKQFYHGVFGERQALPTTNNNRATECGPEPDNGVPPLECEYDGYVALPTVGGCFSQPKWEKPRGELRTGTSQAGLFGNAVTTPAGSAAEGFGADIHSHFTFDHCAHYHAGGADKCRPIGRFPNPNERGSINQPDKTETFPGPYSPVDSVFMPQPAGRFRLCRSFALPIAGSGASAGNGLEAGVTRLAPLPQVNAAWFAPSDLRIDGAYGELNSALGYDTTSVPYHTHMAVAFWMKANWFPENTGKARSFISLGNYDEFFRCPANIVQTAGNWWKFSRPLPFGLYYFPSYFTNEDPWQPMYQQAPRVNSMLWVMSADGIITHNQGGFAAITPTLNHIAAKIIPT
jgi:hypothetical protein